MTFSQARRYAIPFLVLAALFLAGQCALYWVEKSEMEAAIDTHAD